MKWWLLAALCALLQACGGGEGGAAADAAAPGCSVTEQRQSLRTFMDDRYFWYRQLRAPDEAAGTLDAYFHSLLNLPADRFSFTESTAAHNQLFIEGRRVGYGYALVWADAAHSALRVRNVEPASPVARAGLARGDTIVSIDDYSPEQVVQGALPVVDTPGVSRRFLVRTVAGVVRQFDVLSEDFPLTPVAVTKTLDATRAGVPVKVGYLAYHQFVGYSFADLNLAFTRFAQAGIGELILDLRYNGGGSVNTSRDLASMIGGAHTVNRLYAYLRFNDKQANSTQRVLFNGPDTDFAQPLPAGLPRVVVIASGATASASELVINGLRPFVNVVLVGDTTYGKPYGFVPRDNCGITYNAVQFESLNSQGVGGYTAGFAPDCQVADDLDRQLGDPAEARVKVALNYIATGSCGAPPLAGKLAAPGPQSPPAVFGESWPAQMFRD